MKRHQTIAVFAKLALSAFVFSTGMNAAFAACPLLTTDALVLRLAEDAYKGDAQFRLTIDGVAVSSSQAVTVHQPTGGFQDFVFTGNWGHGPHTINVSLANDLWDGTSSADGHDRNLFVESIIYDNVSQSPNREINSGSANFAIPVSSAASDVLVLRLAEDAYKGDAQFIATIDGVAVNSSEAVVVHQPSGLSQDFVFTGNWGRGAHTVRVAMTNDAWSGISSADGLDRNLFIKGIIYDNISLTPNQEIYSGSASFTIEAQTISYCSAINGACGSANNVAAGQAPAATGLCSAGTASSVTGSGPWTWNCAGIDNGTSASCSTPILKACIDANGAPHASGTTYTLQTGQTHGTIPATSEQCVYGGTQAETITTNQAYLCSNGTATAQGAPVSTTIATGNPVCTAPAACGTTASGSVVSKQVGETAGTTAAAINQCPYGGTQPIRTTVTQAYLCTNGTLAAQGSSVSTVTLNGAPTCNSGTVNGSCNPTLTSAPPALTNTTPFPLGAYVGQPNDASATGQAGFINQLTHFAATMNFMPSFLDTYLNAGDPISHWTAQNAWQASSWAATPQLKTVIPVIGLPLTSTADNFDNDYKAFASGANDAVIRTLVQSWAQEGILTQYWRLGWEMNLNGNPSYGGSEGTQEQKDWIAAFQHVSTVLHAAATTYGVNLKVIWNPGVTSYGTAGNAVTYFYPGSQFVDVIGVDVYADAWQFSLWDFTTDKTDATLAVWQNNPNNLIHYYTYPAATEWSLDGSGGHSTTLAQLIALAQTEDKPLAIVETGAGDSNSGHDIADNAVFVNWLAQTLHAAEPAVKIEFVNVWDSNGGGNYEFSQASDNKPLEATAWSEDFGNQIAAPTSNLCAAGSASVATVGSGKASWTCAGTNGGTTASCSTPSRLIAY